MRTLITGATGFVGAQLTRRLVEDGHSVAVLIRPGSDRWRIADQIERLVVIPGDLLNLRQAAGEIRHFGPDAVVHSAWFGVGGTLRNDVRQVKVNLQSAMDLLELCAELGVRHWIGLGSQAEYGPWDVAITEDTPTRPTTLYGMAKLCLSGVIPLLCADAGMRCIWLRLFSVYGPMDDPAWLIPHLIHTLLQGQCPALTDGTQYWDCLYVSDVADAIVKVLHSPNASGVYNLGSGSALPVRAIAERIRDLIDPELPLRFGQVPYQAGQIMHLEADTRRLREAVGWTPAVSLEDGLARTVAWFRDRLDR